MIGKIKKNIFVKNSLILFIGSMIANVLNYLFHLIIGRMVTIEMYGEVESLIALMHIISVPALALTTLVVKYSAIAKADEDIAGGRRIIQMLSKKILFFGTPLFVCMLFLTPFVNSFLKIENFLAIIFIWLVMFFLFFSSINNGALIGWQKFTGNSAVNVVGTLVKLVTAVIFVRIGFGVSGIMGSFVLGTIASYVGTFFVLKFLFIGDRKKWADKKN